MPDHEDAPPAQQPQVIHVGSNLPLPSALQLKGNSSVTAVFNNMRTLKFKPQPTVTFLAAVNQIPGGFRLLPSVYVALTWKGGSAVSQHGGRIS